MVQYWNYKLQCIHNKMDTVDELILVHVCRISTGNVSFINLSLFLYSMMQ